MEEEPFPSALPLLEDTSTRKPLEIDRCGLSLSDTCIDEVLDPAVRLPKQQIHEFSAVDLGLALRDVLDRVLGQIAKAEDLVDGPK